MTTQEIVSKLWNLCNVLRDDGITYHQYVTELTYLLFLKMSAETDNEKRFSEGVSLAEGDADSFGCLFFPETAICLAVFELGRTYRAMRECPQIDAAAMMNAIYRDFPDYAVKYNIMEQAGGGNPLGQALSDANRPASPDWMISLTPDAGTDFLRF